MAGMLALIVLLVVTCLGGRIVLRCFYREKSFLAPAMVAGFVVLLLYMCMWQVVVVKFALPFSVMKYAGIGYFGVVLLLGAVFGRKAQKGTKRAAGKEVWILLANVLVLALLIVDIQIKEPYFGSDMTVEETVTILHTGTVCRYHPATGAELVMGMNIGAKLNCLPGVYAILCECTGADAYTFVCRFVPVWGLLVNYAAVYWLFTLVFGKKRNRTYAMCGMFLYGILLLFGSYHKATYAYRLLCQGFWPQIMLWATGSVIFLCFVLAGARTVRAYKERRIAEHAESLE